LKKAYSSPEEKKKRPRARKGGQSQERTKAKLGKPTLTVPDVKSGSRKEIVAPLSQKRNEGIKNEIRYSGSMAKGKVQSSSKKKESNNKEKEIAVVD